jgi:hypothetical protein
MLNTIITITMDVVTVAQIPTYGPRPANYD